MSAFDHRGHPACRVSRSGASVRPFDLYCSDIAFLISLVIAWELVVLVSAMWFVPEVLAMAAAAGQLGDPALPIGGI